MQILLSNFVGCAVHCDQIRAQFPMSCKSGGCGEGPICKIRPLCGRVTLARHRKERGPRFGSQRRFSRPGSCGLVLGSPFPLAPNLHTAEGGHRPAQAAACQRLHCLSGSSPLPSRISGSGRRCCLRARSSPGGCMRQDEWEASEAEGLRSGPGCGLWERGALHFY